MAQTEVVNAPYPDGTFSNNSNNNATCCSHVFGPASPASAVFAFRFTLASSIVSSVNIAMACTSVFVNSLLLWAIKRVDNSALEAKRLIINLTIANMTFPLLLALDPYYFTAMIHMSVDIISPDVCLLGVYVTIGLILFCAQAACTVGLAGDRIYAVVRPLTYSTIGYSQPMRIFILYLPWILGVTVWAIFMFLTWSSLPPSGIPRVPMFCLHLLNAYLEAERSKTFDSLVAGANVFSFVIYISIFGILKYKERTIQNLSMTTAKKTTLSLARTYFLVNVTTLALYLPAPLFSIITESATGEALTTRSATIASCLLILYTGNTCLDPIILMSRIPSVRKQLPIRFKLGRGQHGRKRTGGVLSETLT